MNHGFLARIGVLVLASAGCVHGQTSNAPVKAAPAATSASPGGALPPAIQAATQLPEGKERTDAMRSAALAWEKQDPRAAMAWAIALPDCRAGTAGFEAVRVAANDWGDREPVAAKEWIVSHAPSPKNGSLSMLALHLIVTAWTRHDPAAAVAWAATQPAGSDVRGMAYYSIGDGWAQKDPAAATAWAATLPAGSDRKIALGKAVNIWARSGKNLDAAVAWVEKLPPADLPYTAPDIATALAKTDATKAKAWVNGLPLADADKATILAKVK